MRAVRLFVPFLLSCVLAPGASAQPASVPATVEVAPAALDLRVGDSAQITATVKDAAGQVLDVPVIFVPNYGQFWNLDQRTWGFNLFKVGPDGLVTASKPGVYGVRVRVPRTADADEAPAAAEPGFIEVEVPLTIAPAPVATVAFDAPPARFLAGTMVRLNLRVVDRAGDTRTDVTPVFASADPAVAAVDRLGYLRLAREGRTEVTATAEGVTARLPIAVHPNPTAALTLASSATDAKTGDVIRLSATATDAAGRPVPDVPVTYTFYARTDDFTVGGPSSGFLMQDGRFVADLPGEYTIVATSGAHSDATVISVAPRDVRREITLVGHGRVANQATSDLWVWEGVDGRDYAITGTHSADGQALIWDVTNPASPTLIDLVRVDARTVNDVKVSEDGRIAVITREGASNRRNGIVLLDVSDPMTGVRILSRFDDELTGGVHNAFIYDKHVYALSAGQRYDIINIEDPARPQRVGRFELPNADRSIHDVWVKDGVAYSANWTDGVVLVDVGGGGKGGSPRNPVMMGQYKFPTGWNHAVYPYRSASTGKRYVLAGDEAARTGSYSPTPERGSGTPGYAREPNRWRGWIHVLEWKEEGEPELVARYEVPEAGSHNIWVEDDVMYVAFYNGGLRVVDLSGELMGNLYRQGREIAHFLPFDPEGFTPNAPQVWGAQPHKGNIFFSDYNSGLWVVTLSDPPSGSR
jgi:hypothetical protein